MSFARTSRLTGLAFAICIGLTQSSFAASISRASLVQYQYSADSTVCPVDLVGGLRIEFDVVFANEGELVVAHPLVIFRIPTQKRFGFATVLRVSNYDNEFLAKVVKQDAGHLYLAFDGTFLNHFWGSEPTSIFEIEEINRSQSSPKERFISPGNMREARVLIGNGLSCFESLQAD